MDMCSWDSPHVLERSNLCLVFPRVKYWLMLQIHSQNSRFETFLAGGCKRGAEWAGGECGAWAFLMLWTEIESALVIYDGHLLASMTWGEIVCTKNSQILLTVFLFFSPHFCPHKIENRDFTRLAGVITVL